MKILVFVENFMGPTKLFIYNEIMELCKTNEVLLITTNRVKEYENDFPFQNIIVIPFKQSRVERKINWILEKKDIFMNRKNKKFSKRLNEIVSTFKPDVIHGHFGYESIILLDNLNKTDIPVIVSFHGYDANEMLKRRCYVNKLNYYIDLFNITPIYVSNYMKKEMEQEGIHLVRARLLYYGTDTNYFKPKAYISNSDNFIFLQISSFIEKKGHTYTLQAFKKFLKSVENAENYRLILAGGGRLFDNIMKEVKELDLTNNVEFTGVITYKETLPLLQQADVFVQHSITTDAGMKEGIPNAIMEAMAMELPVISTKHAGIPELVEDGVNGYLVDEKDIDTYARRMKDILTWKRLSANSKKVQDIFSRETHNKNLLKIYNERI